MSDFDRRRRSWRYLWLALAIIVAVLLLLLLCYCRPKIVTTALQPPHSGGLLFLGDAVVTGFSGLAVPDASRPPPSGRTASDEIFIDINGPSTRIFDPRRPGFVWNGSFWLAPHRRDIPARAVGQVFGVAIDSLEYPNIYLTATSVYGLNLVAPDPDYPGRLMRLKRGQRDAGWAQGQFGPGGGPGSIWKIDGRTGAISHFAEVTLDGKTSGAAALGNIAYDGTHRQLFVSDLSTGMIHRFGLDGVDRDRFDHGTAGRVAAHLAPVPYQPAQRADILRASFDAEDLRTWGFTPAARRIWGLAVYEDRLYYAIATGEIWSVGLDKDGDFLGDPRWEITLPTDAAATPISDIVFTHDGQMIVAQRAFIGATYDYKPLPPAGVAHVYRFSREKPDDPNTPSAWYQRPEEYAVGFSGDSRSSGGGVALGYGYKSDGTIDFADCEDAIFFTGDMLRDFHRSNADILPHGPLELYGLQISPKGPVRGFNAPPSISYFVNYADQMSSVDRSGAVGDVAIYRIGCKYPGCPTPSAIDAALAPPALGGVPAAPPPGGPPGAPPPPGPPGPPGGPPWTPPPCVGPGCGVVPPCVGPGCAPCIGPGCNPSNPQACMEISGEAVCDSKTGKWAYTLTTGDTSGVGLDTLTVHATTPGVSVSNGPDISLTPPPAEIALSGASPGQTVTIDVCGFNDAARRTGAPYDCCHTTLQLQVPEKICTASVGSGAPR